MSEKEHVAIVNYACRICGKNVEAESSILLATRYRTNSKGKTEPVQDLKPMHNQTIGLAKEMCNECKTKFKPDIYHVGIVVDLSKTDDKSNLYRTGEVIQVVKDSNLGKLIQSKKSIFYIDVKEFEKLKQNIHD